jgi:tRNA-dihydrouridine synthase A
MHQQKNFDYFLGHDPAEHPLALQLGGSDVEMLGGTCFSRISSFESLEKDKIYHANTTTSMTLSMIAVAKMAENYGAFHEINLNVGCPSPKVSKRCFGARLMLQPELVRDICYEMMRRVTTTPITVKCRIGVDEFDSYAHFHAFVSTVASSGVKDIIVHARKAYLDGLKLSAHENRTIPPLNYAFVGRLKQDMPHLNIMLNGGVTSIQHAHALLHVGLISIRMMLMMMYDDDVDDV